LAAKFNNARFWGLMYEKVASSPMIGVPLTDPESIRLRWMTLYLQLPPEGVHSLFPDTDACRNRLAEIQWPSGPECPRCHHQDIGFMSKRKTYHCRKCRHQFSVISSTFMRRRRIDLFTWFTGAEIVISGFAKGTERISLTGHSLKDRLGVSYVAAFNIKKDLIENLLHSDVGLIERCICTVRNGVPQDIVPNSREHLSWLSSEMPGKTSFQSRY
jgi:hypothetical protein